MKFLILQKVRTEIPIDMRTKLLPAEFKYLEKLEKKKIIESSYHLIGQQGNILIVNADSDEKLSRIISEDPMFFHAKGKSTP